MVRASHPSAPISGTLINRTAGMPSRWCSPDPHQKRKGGTYTHQDDERGKDGRRFIRRSGQWDANPEPLPGLVLAW